jgi:hypothetical protein
VSTLLTTRLWFPDPCSARKNGEFDGLVAIGGDLSVPRMLLAYRSGIFPWTDNPLTWWSPDPRAIFELDLWQAPQSLARAVRKSAFRVTVDRAFRKIVEGCAAPAPGRTDQRQFHRSLRATAQKGPRAQRRVLAGSAARRRHLWHRHRRLLRGRIDVSPREQRFQGGPGLPHPASAGSRLCSVRRPINDTHHASARGNNDSARRIFATTRRRR